ncbi:MAG TPA: ATP-binding protein [Bacteroidetes bacterium]|nr:ATP-binding protein [Bacteroidota bacterium]
MNKKIRLWASVLFLLAGIISLILYFTTAEKTYSDQTIKNLSDKLQTHVVSFLENNQSVTDSLKRDFDTLKYSDLTPDFLNRYAYEKLQNNPAMQGMIIFGNRFHFLFVRDKNSWAATYDTILNDTLTNWVRLNNKLDVVGRWTDTYNYFIDEVSINKTRQLLKQSGKQSLWKVLLNKGTSQKDFILSSNIIRLKDGKNLAFAFVYDLRNQNRAFFPFLKLSHPIVSLVTPLEYFTVPLNSADTSLVSSRYPVVEQIGRLLKDWGKSPHPAERSYLFIQEGRKYWMHVALIPHSLGMRAVAYATTEKELEMVGDFKKNLYGYASLFFGFVAFLWFVSLRKKKTRTTGNSISSFVGNSPTESDILHILEKGESEQSEFKSSLRWDYREQKVNPVLEMVILKSIAAFANGKGGVLIIGVNDEEEILGLEPDFNTLKKKDADGFELHLRRLIKNQFGISFSTAHLELTFPEAEGKTLCVIGVTPSDHPLYLKTKNKNGNEIEKFYVRMGNASQEISSLREIQQYIKNRFE